jgi:hypothetical protein
MGSNTMRPHVRAALVSLAVGAACFVPVQSGRAGVEECGEAVAQYNAALSDLEDALRRYASCVADSRGHDDCSVEFSQLRSAQDDFETAVSEYESECT